MVTLRCLVTMVIAVAMAAAQSGPVFDYNYPNLQVESLGETVRLNCSYYNNPEDAEPDGRWINAKVTLMDFNTGNFPGYALEDNGWLLRIDSLTRDDIGFWHCIMFSQANQTQFLRRLGLNAQGPFFEDLWQKYQRNVTIGLGAGFGFAVFATVVCLAWQFRWEKRQSMRAVRDAGVDGSKSPVIEMKPLPEKISGVEPQVDLTSFVVTSSRERLGSANGAENGKVNAGFAAFEVEPEEAVKVTESAQSEKKKPSPPPSYVESEETAQQVVSKDSSAPGEPQPSSSTTNTTSTPATTSTPVTTIPVTSIEPQNTNNSARADIHF